MRCLVKKTKLESNLKHSKQKHQKNGSKLGQLEPVALLKAMAGCFSSPLSGKFRRIETLDDYDKVIAENPLDPSLYTDAYTFSQDYLLRNVLAKYNDGDGDEMRAMNAIEKFLDVEERMREINHKFFSLMADPSFVAENHDVIHILCVASEKMERLVRYSPSLDEILPLCQYTSGASLTMVRRRGTTPGHKFSSPNLEISPGFFGFAKLMIEGISTFYQPTHQSQVYPANRIATVPKNRKTDRTIAIEPKENMFLQRGIGRWIRRRLKKVGINLDDQTINQELARRGSIDGSLATVDLSSASDSVSLGVISFLFPERWFELFSRCRSVYYQLPDGTTGEYAKLSSMGNGFTFEVESAIFWSICSAICSKDETFSVYGDDIIIPSHHVDTLEKVLTFIGFKFNEDKTFKSGPFRESCGKHYFRGEDVTPLFYRQPGSYREEKIAMRILLANNIWRWSRRNTTDLLQNVYSRVLDTIPDYWKRFRIPDGLGDGALVGNYGDPGTPSRGYYRGVGPCFAVPVLLQRFDEATQPPEGGAYLDWLLRANERVVQQGNPVTLSLDRYCRPSAETYFLFVNEEGCETTYSSTIGRYKESRLVFWAWPDSESPIGVVA